MKMKISELSDKFSVLLGDTSLDIDDKFVINAVNWCFNELPRVPKLGRLFSKHYTVTLDAKDHYKWNLNQDFRRISDIPMINFWTSTGGEPCRLNLCNLDTVRFYNKNGLPELRKAGTPCEYTIEKENDDIFLVMDRPSDVPVIVDYIAYGYPKPVSSLEDVVDISSIAENLMLSVMKTVFYYESQDFAFAEAISQYLDSKALLEATQELYKKFGAEEPQIIGEA